MKKLSAFIEITTEEEDDDNDDDDDDNEDDYDDYCDYQNLSNDQLIMILCLTIAFMMMTMKIGNQKC